LELFLKVEKMNDNYKYKLFGRFKGRKKNNQSSLLNLTKYNVNFEKDIDINKYNILDIGSGSGENAVYLSNLYPQANIIACELFHDGNLNLCNEISFKNLNNIILFNGNVLEFLDKLNNKLIFNEIWILFPDPWPKKRHQKRRLLNSSFLKKLHFYLKNNGKLSIASDSHSYIHSILRLIDENRNLFLWENQSFEKWNYTNLDLPATKFSKKALETNRKSFFFKLNKI